MRNRKIGFIDKTGHVVVPPEWDVANDFAAGFAYVKSGDKFGCLSAKGPPITPAQWTELQAFQDGFAPVCSEEKSGRMWGYLDATGKVAVPLEWRGHWEIVGADGQVYRRLMKMIDGAPDFDGRGSRNLADIRGWGHDAAKVVYLNRQGEQIWESEDPSPFYLK